jgi:hypothetical protein
MSHIRPVARLKARKIMSARWEYKVVFVDSWRRVSIEGEETHPEEGERTSGFARRFLNGMGADGWELSGIQLTAPGQAYYTFKRELADGAEPDLTVARNGIVREQAQSSDPAGPQAVAL